ncbi:MAG TPA: LysM peptidoglycan-binding domain-containing protein [Spirochaetales bacterium]|nr:LysM peptidoglycan-binding domain-containing protein [Spirochaetales bacterium]
MTHQTGSYQATSSANPGLNPTNLDGNGDLGTPAGSSTSTTGPTVVPDASNVQSAATDTQAQSSSAAADGTSLNTIVSAGVLVDGLQYDIPMPWGHEEFEAQRAYYLTSGGKKWLQAVMERALPYIAYVEKKVEELKLPKELIFLPVIESGYSPFAVSRSGATGIWQFMRNSISGYDMAISDWLDDRKDFMKSTDAALLKLRENYNTLGDWPLAIAAYNAGLGAVSRAVKASGSDTTDFWSLYESKKLAREPLSYVPRFLAVASILRYPTLHGLPDEWGEKNDWTTVETSRQVDLSILAEKAGIPLDILKCGNAELRYNITPPVDTHTVKVPAEKAEAAKTVLEDTNSPLMNYTIYKVKSGDTLSKIAQTYKTPISLILKANPGVNVNKIAVGQILMIPRISGDSAASGSSKADNTTSTSTSTPSANTNASAKLSYTTYTVKKGDSLSKIASLFSTSVSAIAKDNGISPNSIIRIGQKLKVPVKQ